MSPHPSNLAMIAALWSLRVARQRLDIQAAIANRERGLALTEVADGLRSQTYGNRQGLGGGHSDPTAGAAINGTHAATSSQQLTNRLEQLAASTIATLSWLADRLQPGAEDPLLRLHTAAPTLRPATAATAGRWVAEQDQRIRQALGLDPDRQLLVGLPCPACRVRRVYVQTSAPDRVDWTVICAAGCVCAGGGCPCGMSIKVVGLGHIWTAESVLAERLDATLAA